MNSNTLAFSSLAQKAGEGCKDSEKELFNVGYTWFNMSGDVTNMPETKNEDIFENQTYFKQNSNEFLLYEGVDKKHELYIQTEIPKCYEKFKKTEHKIYNQHKEIPHTLEKLVTVGPREEFNYDPVIDERGSDWEDDPIL